MNIILVSLLLHKHAQNLASSGLLHVLPIITNVASSQLARDSSYQRGSWIFGQPLILIEKISLSWTAAHYKLHIATLA
jgi:hypothetical protein